SNYETLSRTRQRWNVHMVIEDTHVFSPTFVNTFRVGLYKEKVTDGIPLYGVDPVKGNEVVAYLGLQGVNPQGLSAMGVPQMNISGYLPLMTPPGGVPQDDYDWGYADTATWSKGRHVIKFGGEYKPQNRFVNLVPTGTYGDFMFNGTFTGYGYSD